MTTPRPESALLRKEAKQLLDGSKAQRRTRKSQVMNMSGTTLTREMKRLSINDRSKGETGIMRVQVLNALGLGLPTVKTWTKKSIIYMLEEIFEHNDFSEENVKNKGVAISYLQEFLARKCLGPPPMAPDSESATSTPTYRNLAKQLRELGNENDARICDHADSFGEQIDPDTFERLMELTDTTWNDTTGEKNSENGTAKRLFNDTDPITPDTLRKKRQLLMQQMTAVDKLMKQHPIEQPRQLRKRNQDVVYVEEETREPNTSSSSNSTTEDITRQDTTVTRANTIDTALQRSHSTGSFGIIWSRYDSTNDTGEKAKLFLQRPLNLTRTEEGWEKIVNFANTREMIYQDHAQVNLRGLHFFSACALLVAKCDNIEDNTGFGDTPTMEGNEELAREWLGLIYQAGVRRLGSGCVFEQIKFSNAARRGLAGAGTKPPDPSHVATFFSQLYNAAGASNTRRRNQATYTSSATHNNTFQTTIPPPHAHVPQETIDTITTQARSLAPIGMDLSILDQAITTIASKKGATFRDKQVGGIKALGNGSRSKDTERESHQELDWTTATSAKQATNAAVSLSTDALESARITKSNVALMNCGHSNVKKCILAILMRKFTSEDFQMHLMIPRTTGAPDTKDIKIALGEAQTCKRTGGIANVSSETEDRKYYGWFRLGVEAIIVIVAPSLDFGLTSALRFFADNTPIFEACGTPLCMVTRALCKTLIAAERQREQALTSKHNTTELLLSYSEPPEIMALKQKLLSWSRDEQEDEYIRFKRCMDTHQSPNTTVTRETGKKKESNNSRPTRNSRTEVKSEREKPPTLPNFTRKTWSEKYGPKTVRGNKVKLCFYHCNRQGGCAQMATCPNDHTTFPDKYNGKHFADLTEGQRSEVLAACQKP